MKTNEYALPAKWLKNSRLRTGKLCLAPGIELPDWRMHLDGRMHQLT